MQMGESKNRPLFAILGKFWESFLCNYYSYLKIFGHFRRGPHRKELTVLRVIGPILKNFRMTSSEIRGASRKGVLSCQIDVM